VTVDLVGSLAIGAPTNNTEPMSSVLDRVAETGTALADPTRAEILERLSAGPATVTQLAGLFPMSLRGVLKHVQLLEEAGLLSTAKVGRSRTCQLRPDGLVEIAAWITETRSRWERRLDRMEAHLSTRTKEKR